MYFPMEIVFYLVVLAPFVVVLAQRPNGAKWLQRWGLGRPANPDEAAAARRYLREGRVWAVLAFVLLWVGLVVVSVLRRESGSGSGISQWVAALLLGLLLGQLATALRTRRRPVRTASLMPRPTAVVVPAWARRLLVLGALVTVVLVVVVVLQARWWGGALPSAVTDVDRNDPATVSTNATVPAAAWVVLVGVLLVLTGVGLVVRRALDGPPSTAVSEDVDLLLRARTARVAVGAGLGATGLLLSTVGALVHDRVVSLVGVTSHTSLTTVASNASGVLPVGALLVFVLAWMFVGNPPGRPLLRAVRAGTPVAG